MPTWWIKSIIHQSLSQLPRSYAWNELFQSYFTHTLDLPNDAFLRKVQKTHRLWLCRERFNENGSPCRAAIEFGPGWFGIAAMSLYLLGVDRIWTCDIYPLLRARRVRKALNCFLEAHQNGSLAEHLPGYLVGRMERIRAALAMPHRSSANELLAALNIQVLVQDAQRLPLESQSVDFFVSNDVLGYIPREVLLNILRETHRLSKPDALHVHHIDLADLYHYFDRNVSPFHFLQFSDRKWKFFNSPLHWQSRMRITDYQQLFAEAGLKILEQTDIRGLSTDLARITVAPEFQHYSDQELLVQQTTIVACSKVSFPVGSADRREPAPTMEAGV